MNRLQEHLMRAGTDLGVTIIAPFTLTLNSGRKLCAEALLPEFGAPKGTIVCRSFTDYLDILDELKSSGYTCSSFDEPLPNEEYDVESYREMFMDWSWTSKERPKPAWMS